MPSKFQTEKRKQVRLSSGDVTQFPSTPIVDGFQYAQSLSSLAKVQNQISSTILPFPAMGAPNRRPAGVPSHSSGTLTLQPL